MPRPGGLRAAPAGRGPVGVTDCSVCGQASLLIYLAGAGRDRVLVGHCPECDAGHCPRCLRHTATADGGGFAARCPECGGCLRLWDCAN